jgi:glycosyltransferase involved in cell wall biosynthesis
MNILFAPAHVILNSRYGSEVAWAYNVIETLAKRFRINIIAICGKAENLTLPNVKVLEIGYDKGDLVNRFLFYFKCYHVAKKLYKNVNIVHHMFPFDFRKGFNLLAVLRDLKEKPFIIGPVQYPQEYLDTTDYEWVSGRKGLKATLFYGLENAITKLISQPIDIFHELTLSEAEALTFDSKKTLNLYKSLYSDLLKGKMLEVIPPGIEIDVFRYIPPVKKDHFELMTAGYLLKRKGIQYLIEAMPIILREYKNVILRIVGDGPFKSELMKLVKRLSLSDKVRFEGLVPRSELAKYYAQCDVYVQPSLSETFPATIREAMSVGRPVIATRVGFAEEHIINGVNGFLVPRGDVKEIANKVLLLLSDEDLRLKIGARAREYAEKNFDWNKIANMWYSIYSKLIRC